ncbi:hypothetical protein Aperf_G00000019370 [Anoplocephala perfoliata]
MDLPQSKTDDCLLDLAESTDDLKNPPKPAYLTRFTKNVLPSEHQKYQPTVSQQPQKSDVPVTSNSLYSLQPPPPYKVPPTCNNHGSDSHKISTLSRRPSGISIIGYKYSQAVIQDPSTGRCLRICCEGWMAILKLIIALRAILARFVFLALTFILVNTVVRAKGEKIYWLLCLLMLPLLVDLCYSIRQVIAPRRSADSTEKWFTKCLLAFLFCACPPIWIAELHQLQIINEATETVINNPGLINPGEVIRLGNPWADAGLVYNEPGENLVIMGESIEDYLNATAIRNNITVKASDLQPRTRIKRSSEDILCGDEPHSEAGVSLPDFGFRSLRRGRGSHDELRYPTKEESLIQAVTLQHYPLKMRIRILEQLLLLSVIVGRWLLPRLGISRDQLSQLLLINIGNAADILELFEAFNEEAVRMNSSLRICILCLWQASLLQFCFNKTAVLERKHSSFQHQAALQVQSFSRSSTLNDFIVVERPQLPEEGQNSSIRRRHFCNCCPKDPSDDEVSGCAQLWFGTELWAICMSLILQDIPFLVLRLALVIFFNVRSYSNIFFTCKNSLLILLQVFRSVVILGEFRRNWRNANSDIPLILVP